MAWLKLDDKRATHRKFRRQGFAARGLDEAAMCWCAHEESDGHVSEEALEDLAHHHGVSVAATRKLAAQLVKMGRWDVHVDDGWNIRDYLHFNPSRIELETKRRRDRERKRRHADSEEEA